MSRPDAFELDIPTGTPECSGTFLVLRPGENYRFARWIGGRRLIDACDSVILLGQDINVCGPLFAVLNGDLRGRSESNTFAFLVLNSLGFSSLETEEDAGGVVEILGAGMGPLSRKQVSVIEGVIWSASFYSGLIEDCRL